MESSTSRAITTQKRQEELKAQIAALQLQLAEIPDDQISGTASLSPKRKTPEPTLLAPATPSPKKKRRIEGKDNKQSHSKGGQTSFRRSYGAKIAEPNGKPSAPVAERVNTAPSKFLGKLAEVKSRSNQSPVPDSAARTSAFSDQTRPSRETNAAEATDLKRDDRLALIEDLEPGPYEFTPPSDDPEFQRLEPHSGIRLSNRILSHEDLQEHLRARYYLSPSRLYSIVRLLPDKQGYDVPVLGDWVTIAVVAERGPIKVTRAPVTLDPDEQDKKPWQKNKGKTDEVKKASGKKYVNFKLIDFGARSKSAANGGESVIRGDAFLTLLLFESDRFDLIQKEDGQRPQKLYKGGSRGAFEMMAKVKEGDVIALLNPKILKPFQRSNDSPHPVNNILAVTPESGESIAIIGRSRDLGMCSVTKRDGKACGSWCDTRVSDVCEYHLQNAVQHRRAGRPEFSIGTSGMSNTSVYKRKTNYDPARQWGLKPESAVGSTYVISGHVVHESDTKTMYVGEKIGREGQAKAQRKSGADADRVLKTLLQRDRDGMLAVMRAREASDLGRVPETDERSGKGKQNSRSREDIKSFDDAPVRSRGSGYTAGVIKQLSFDPSHKAGLQKNLDSSATEKLEVLKNIRSTRKEITLGSRPGPKIRSGVMVPTRAKPCQAKVHQTSITEHDGQDGAEEKMVDLDDL